MSGTSLASSCVSVHLRCLRVVGFCRAAAGARGAALHGAYRGVALAAVTLYLVQEIIYAYQERTDMEKLSRVMFLLLCHVTSIVKQVVFHTDADRIDKLVDSFDEAVFAPRTAAGRRLLARCAGSARRLQRAYAGTAVLTCTLWLVFPAAQYAQGHQVEFPFWIGFNYNHPLGFAALLLYSYYVTTLVGIANTTMDAFMATILYQCKTQLTILRMELSSFVERGRATAGAAAREEATMRLLVRCVHHYKRICEQCALLEEVFGGAILVQFTIGGWILCMAAYKLVSLQILSIEFASIVLFLICILTELFLYCYYGNEVTVESSMLVTAMYSSGWEGVSAAGGAEGVAGADGDGGVVGADGAKVSEGKAETQRWSPRGAVAVRRALVFCMERAHRPLRPTASGLVPLSLETFLTILKSSYTFYAVLRQTK